MRKLILLMIILGLTSLTFAGNTYYLIAHGSQDPYWNSIFEGAKAAAKNLNVPLQILAPAGANDVPKQVQYLESAIASHPAGIATTIPSNAAFAKSLQRAKKMQIPVVAFDTKPEAIQNNPYLAYLGSDNYSMGLLAGKYAYETGKIKNRVVILNPQPGHVGLNARAKGIKEILERHQIVVDMLDVGVDPALVQKRVAAHFNNYPDTSVIFCLTSQSLDPVGQMLLRPKETHFTYKPHVITFDNTPNTAKLIQLGKVDLAMDQQPYLMGYLSISELVLWNRARIRPVDVNTSTGQFSAK